VFHTPMGLDKTLLQQLSDVETARGLITFLVAVSTRSGRRDTLTEPVPSGATVQFPSRASHEVGTLTVPY
jgi:hypothetical protein